MGSTGWYTVPPCVLVIRQPALGLVYDYVTPTVSSLVV